MNEHIVALDDSTLSQAAALRDISARHAAAAGGVRADIELLTVLCADSSAGQAFSSGGGAGLITAILSATADLTDELRRITDGLIAGAAALADADGGPA